MGKIDTAGDAFKPDNNSAYVKFIYRMIKKAHNIIISAGRLVPWKGFDVF